MYLYMRIYRHFSRWNIAK